LVPKARVSSWKSYQPEWKDNPRFKKYRITAKNSVEHVYPQQEEYQRYLDKEILDSFGNLVLLSPGENSAYSNQAVGKKKSILMLSQCLIH
jgi:hypothetical protein